MYLDQTACLAGENRPPLEITTCSLDAPVCGHGSPPPDLIQLDVQGAELEVLRVPARNCSIAMR